MNRNISIAGGLLTIVAVFLPLLSLNFLGTKLSFSLWTGSQLQDTKGVAYFIIVLGLIGAGVGFANRRFLNIVNILVGLLVLFLGLKYWSDCANSSMKEMEASSGLGTYFLMLGGLLLLVGAIWGVAKKKAVPAVTPAA